MKFKGKFYSRQDYARMGLGKAAEMFYFQFSTLVLAYQETEMAEAVDVVTDLLMRGGGRLENIYHEFPAMRNAATFVINFDESYATSERDLQAFSRMTFDEGRYVNVVRGMFNNTMPPEKVARYLVVLAKELAITNAALRNFASIIMKFNRIPIAQQVDAVRKMYNYSSQHYRGSDAVLLTNAMHHVLKERYGERAVSRNSSKSIASGSGSDDKIFGVKKDTMMKAAFWGLVGAGTVKLTKALTDLIHDPKIEDNWARKIAGKEPHKGFDDIFRK